MESTCKETPKDSELATILTKFNEQLYKLDEFSNIILDKTSKIHEYREPLQKEDCDKKIQRPGFVGECDNSISRFSDYNNRLEEIVKGLDQIVG